MRDVAATGNMNRFFKAVIVISGTGAVAVGAVKLAEPAWNFVVRLIGASGDVGATMVDRVETSPHDGDFNVVIARVLSKSKGTPIRWNYYDRVGGADYNVQEPSVVVEFDREPRLRWLQSRHTELCTSRWAYVWQRHWSQPGGGSYHSGSVSAEDSVFEFKNKDGSLRWTVSVTKAC